MVKAREILKDLTPFAGSCKNRTCRLKLDCNENVFGVSKFVLNILKNIDEKELLLYSNTETYINKFCEKHNIEAKKVLFFDKKNYALMGITGAYIDENDEFLSYNSELNTIKSYVKCQKGILKRIEYEKDFVFDKNSIIQNISEKTKIIYISTPDIICGRIIKASLAESIIKDYPEILFIIDCSYISYCENSEIEDFMDLTEKYENVIILKSYSSDCALAGFDLNVIVSNESIINELKKIIVPDDVTSLALICSAAAENDTNKIEENNELIKKNKKLLIDGLINAGYKPYDSSANFIICDFYGYSDFYYKKFKNNGILVKKFEKNLPYSSCLRITVPTEGGVRYILELIKKKDVLIFNPERTLFDTANSYMSAIVKTIEILTGEHISKEKAIKARNSSGLSFDIDIINQILDEMYYGPNEEEITKTYKETIFSIDEETQKKYIENTTLLLSLEEIEKLSKKYDLALVSNREIKEIKYLLEKLNIERFFNYISYNDINEAKVHIPALSVKLITSNFDDIIAGNNCNIDTIGVTVNEIENGSQLMTNNFKHLGAKYILNDIKSLPDFLKDFKG